MRFKTFHHGQVTNQRTNGPVNAHLISGPIRFLNVFTINKQGGHLGHVICTIYINFLSHFPRRLHTKFGFDWPKISEQMFDYNRYIHVYSPGTGADNPLGSNSFH